MPMHDYVQILDGLKLSQLQSLAVSIGTQCSGTKTAIKSSIREILPRRDSARLRRPLSIVSIDMGIRNLAYAHLTADLNVDVGARKSEDGGCYRRPCLCAWEKIAIAPSKLTETSESESDAAGEDTPSSLSPKSRRTEVSNAIRQSKNDAFAPHLYAVHAVSLIKRVMAHKPTPTHILIERQRFRSGGSPIVQDWSIRVGVFEGMLYAVLRTLAEIETGSGMGIANDRAGNSTKIDVEGVLPGRVVRYWADRGGVEETATESTKLKGKAMKKLKIDLVGRTLEESLRHSSIQQLRNSLATAENASTNVSTSLQIGKTAHPTVSAYLSKWTKGDRSKPPSSHRNHEMTNDSYNPPPPPPAAAEELSKLDDLADCLLQGMAWIEWENNRARVTASKDLESMLSLSHAP